MTSNLGAITRLFWLGGQFSVILFFVLSGFVLALPRLSGTQLAYGPFIVRRICRLYIPFAFAVLVSALLCALLSGVSTPNVSAWLLQQWAAPPTLGLIASHLLMTGIHEEAVRLDGPIWSLIVEMRMSLIFPLLVMFAARFRWLGVGLALGLALICAKARASLGETSLLTADSLLGAALFTGYYVLMFLLGITLALQQNNIKSIFVFISKSTHLFITAAFVIIFLILTYIVPPYDLKNVKDVFFSAFAAYIIAAVISYPSLHKSLSASPLLWLGDMSYSLYLIHLPVLMALVYVFSPHMSLRVILCCAAPVMMLAGHVTHVAIEQPSIRLGRALVRRG